MLFTVLNISPVNNYSKGYENLQKKNKITDSFKQNNIGPINYKKNTYNNAITIRNSKVYNKKGKIYKYIKQNQKIRVLKENKNSKVISYVSIQYSKQYRKRLTYYR